VDEAGAPHGSNALGDPVALSDPDGRLLTASAALAERLGRPLHTLLGHRLHALDDRVICAALKGDTATEAILQQGDQRFPVQLTPLGDGTWLWRLAQTTAARDELPARQAARLQSVGELAAGVAHEINTPSQFVRDNLRFLADAADMVVQLLDGLAVLRDDPAADLRENLSAILDATDADFLREELPGALRESSEGMAHIVEVVRSMKEFCHPGGRQESVDLNGVVRTTLTLARNAYKYVAEGTFEPAPELPPVQGVTGDLSQVVLNLIVNAAQAIEGSAAGRGRIRIRTRVVDGWVECAVEDDGPGIPPEVTARIFDRFFTTKTAGVGTGQGLSLALRIVEEHGGSIQADDSAWGGARFTVRLPIRTDL
jgi:two-component system, NtrC family, sensor kinase